MPPEYHCMRSPRIIASAGAATVLAAALALFLAPSARAFSAPGDAPESVPSAATHLLDLTNRDRAAAGVAPLSMRQDVTAIAERFSETMASDGNLRHNDDYFTTATRTSLNASQLGENVAENTDVDDAHARLMNSPGHRANLLDSHFSVVGIAVVRDGDGVYWITEDFLQPKLAVAAKAPVAPRATVRTTAAPRPVAAPQPTSTTTPAPVVIESAPVATADTVLASASTPVSVRLASTNRPTEQSHLVLLGGVALMMAIGLAGTAIGVRRSLSL